MIIKKTLGALYKKKSALQISNKVKTKEIGTFHYRGLFYTESFIMPILKTFNDGLNKVCLVLINKTKMG